MTNPHELPAAHAPYDGASARSNASQSPVISLPPGGGAVRGIGEKFATDPATGTGKLTVPIVASPGRNGFGPQLTLTYDSGVGNGSFGIGWSLGLPSITRKTDKGLPQYDDAVESDVFLLSGAEDLTPVLVERNGQWAREVLPVRTVGGIQYQVQRYRPRVEGLFARIEKWTSVADRTDTFWRSISRDNVTTWYGRNAASRISKPPPAPADANQSRRIFSWLVCAMHDDRGNVIAFDYKAENSAGVDLSKASEARRDRTANRYVKRIRYGNHRPYLPNLDPIADWPLLPLDDQWHFELVFDYGEHDIENPVPQDSVQWHARSDPFSSYRSGFEVRTHRLCRRVLMFHHFPDEPGVGANCLVRSTDLTYAHEHARTGDEVPAYAQVTAISQRGFQRNGAGYRSRALPPLEFGYTKAIIRGDYGELSTDSLDGLPAGIDDAVYRCIDLDGEGLPGILTEQAHGWLYKRNISPLNDVVDKHITHATAKFSSPTVLRTRPGITLAAGARFLDLAGNGRLDVVQLAGPDRGFYERNDDDSWAEFTAFRSLPNRDWNDPNLRFIDLNGDGLADVLITEHGALVWHPSLGREGFGTERRIPPAFDENDGPALVFAEPEQSIYLADMSGDGLTDLVRIRNGEVCYWPNLGYGHFGAKIVMDNSPHFDAVGQFDSQRIRIADIDGSGTVDIIYLGGDHARVYLNHFGNRWGGPIPLPAFPPTCAPINVQALDLLGTGTACLVWSSPLPGDTARPLRYLDLIGPHKPHLLCAVRNNMGAETTIDYAPSTKFYFRDQLAGKAWVTKLPFPVHVVERVTQRDHWQDSSFTTTYHYHHGHFDGHEREFRGFGRVEQVDTENFGTFSQRNVDSTAVTADEKLYQAPVKTVTWFHTGASGEHERILHQLQEEYFPGWFEPGRRGSESLGAFRENVIPGPDLDTTSLTGADRCEAQRACRGLPLRQEIYELDHAALASGREVPVRIHSATTHTSHIRRIQPRADNRTAVFLTANSETIDYHYELDLQAQQPYADPRITHTLNLRFDEYGNTVQSVTVGYPRAQPATLNDPMLPGDADELITAVQTELHVAYTETRYTSDAFTDPDSHRLRLPCAVEQHELAGIQPEGTYFTLPRLRRFRLSDRYPVEAGSPPIAVEFIAYDQLPDHARPQRRLTESTRSLFFNDSLDGPLPLGNLTSRAVPYEAYTLALSETLLSRILDAKFSSEVQAQLRISSTSGYLSGPEAIQVLGEDSSGQYWQRSGGNRYGSDSQQHFFHPDRFTDPFGGVTRLEYHRPTDLFLTARTDALGNRTEVGTFDFRVLAPRRVVDINGNATEVVFDILGVPSATAVSGKLGEGDRIGETDSAVTDPSLADLIRFFVLADYEEAQAKALLRAATVRHIYYFGELQGPDGTVEWGQHPPCAATIKREQHSSEQSESAVQTAFVYSDGGGAVIVQKIQGTPAAADGPLRWIASGKTIRNNKGKPVKQYEPYFSPPEVGHRFEEPSEIGVTPLFFYDAVGRQIRVERPDGAVGRVEFSPWNAVSYDENDTVLEPGNHWFARMSASTVPAERRAAQLAAAHANTPACAVLDSLGRSPITIAHNRTDAAGAKHVTFTRLDGEGQTLWVQDARGNRVIQHVSPPLPDGEHALSDPDNVLPSGLTPSYGVSGQVLFQHSMDAGDRWILPDAAGQPMFAWDSRGFRRRVVYDALHRKTGVFVVASGDTTLEGIARDPAGPPDPESLVELTVYGEAHPQAQLNLRGQVYQVYDGAGVATHSRYDFKGNLLDSVRSFAADYTKTPDWASLVGLDSPDSITVAAQPLLDPGLQPLASTTTYDALNRPTSMTSPDGSMQNARYERSGLLDRIAVTPHGAAQPTLFVAGIRYNAKGQRERVEYGNGTATEYGYEDFTFRLNRIRTSRPAHTPDTVSALFVDPAVVQGLAYTYDPVGNITRIEDSALKATVQASAACDYVYDALYRLTAASGREHRGQTDFALSSTDASRRDYPFAGARIHPNDLQGLDGYVERYRYDSVGNLMQLTHHTGTNVDQPGAVRWQRHYQYALDSNRLLATSLPDDHDDLLPDYATFGGYSARYGHNQHGDITAMPHLPVMRWNYRGQLSATSQQVVVAGTPELTYFVYDTDGRRARKVTETSGGARKNERIYCSGTEIYLEYTAAAVSLQRGTLHVMDDEDRIAIVETESSSGAPARTRYEYDNHLSSASVELDQDGALVSYEEYHPYGTTAFQLGKNATEVKSKRYRYTAKERDDETGFSDHGARYYAAWLGRWISADPVGIADGVNLYQYVAGNPVRLVDRSGLAGTSPSDIPGLISDHPNLLKAWDAATEKVLGPRYGSGTAEQLRRQFAKDVEQLAIDQGTMGSNRAKGTAIHAGRQMYSRVRSEFGRTLEKAGSSVKGLQAHHADHTVANNPGGSLNPDNISLTNPETHRLAHKNLPAQLERKEQWLNSSEAVAERAAEESKQLAATAGAAAGEAAAVESKVAGAAKAVATSGVIGKAAKALGPVGAAVGVFFLREKVAAAASAPAPTGSTTERAISTAGTAADIGADALALVPGEVGLVAFAAKAQAEIAMYGIKATGGDDRIQQAGATAENYATRLGATRDQAQAAGATAAGLQSVGEGAAIIGLEMSGPIGWGVLALRSVVKR